MSLATAEVEVLLRVRFVRRPTRYGAAMAPPLAVLLDVGGVFFLPDHERIVGAFARAEHPVAAEMLDDAHYAAAVRFGSSGCRG